VDRERGGSRSIHDDAQLPQLLAENVRSIGDGSQTDDGCSVLVVVHDRNIAEFFQLALDLEALWRLDIFEVDSPEGGRERLDHRHEFVFVLLLDTQIDSVDVRKLLEEHGLAFHYWL